MLTKLKEFLYRNPCKECLYYSESNNTCQSKKCATCGCHPYVTWFDKLFCKPWKGQENDSSNL